MTWAVLHFISSKNHTHGSFHRKLLLVDTDYSIISSTATSHVFCHQYDCDVASEATLKTADKIHRLELLHYSDFIISAMASQITSLTIVYSAVCSGVDQRKHQSSASLAFVRGIHSHRWIPRTKGQLLGKCFYLMTSPWGVDSTTTRKQSTTKQCAYSMGSTIHANRPLTHPPPPTTTPGQNDHGRHFAEDIFKCIFMKENFYILIRISLKFVSKGPIVLKSALVQVMAWRRPGNKPLQERMSIQFNDA